MKFSRDPMAAISLLVVIAIVLGAAFAPWITSVDPYDNDLAAAMQAPGGEYILGADDQGRDMLVRLLYGTRLTLLMGVHLLRSAVVSA